MKAFPNPTLSDTENNSPETLNDRDEYGMDLRDYFAAKCMQGLVDDVEKPIFSYIAEVSYKMADAMMEARNAR